LPSEEVDNSFGGGGNSSRKSKPITQEYFICHSYEIEVATLMKRNGACFLILSPDVELGKKILKACYDGGARI